MQIFCQTKKYDKAITIFEELSGIDREDLSVRFNIGRLYLEQGRFDDAIREFSLILASKPDYNIVRLYLGVAWKEKGNTQNALEEFQKVNPASEEYLAALDQIIRVYIKSGKLDEGITLIEKRLSETKKKKELYFLLSMLYEEKDDYAKAVEMLEEIRKLSPIMLMCFFKSVCFTSEKASQKSTNNNE